MDPSEGPEFKIGQRVHSAGDSKTIGSVKYVGPVEGHSGNWVGVDWDNGDGKHDGSMNGVRYFQAAFPGSGSFVRPAKLCSGITLLEALHLRYRGETTKEEKDEMYVLSATNRKVSIKLVGTDKIENKHRHFKELSNASVAYLGVSSSGPPSQISEVAPNLKELDLTGNLLCDWKLINHGMTLEFLDQIRDSTKKFFYLPSEEKEKYSKMSDNLQGYGTGYDPSDRPPASYRLFLHVYPEDQRIPECWPTTPYNLRDILYEFTSKVKRAHDLVVQAMARSLNLEDNAFLDGYGENSDMVARINYYLPYPLVDLLRSISKHTDMSAVTFLLLDREVEALEVEKDGHWFKVPIIPHAFMVIVGDQLEIMSNGIFKSVPHRVKPNLEKDRMSFAMFCSPDADKEIGPLKELVTQDRPTLYRPIKKYIDSFFENYPKGIEPITTVKI